MKSSSVTRWIRGYDNEDHLRVEYRLPSSWTLQELQRLFRVPGEDPMYDCYPIGDAQALVLESSVGQSLRLKNHEFFLEADADEQ